MSRLQAASPATPLMVAYSDDYGFPSQGFGPYTTIIIAFLMPGSSPGDVIWGPNSTFWSGGQEVNKLTYLVQNQPQIFPMVSIGGQFGWSSQKWQSIVLGNETQVAASIQGLVKGLGLDPSQVGVDIDYEDDAGVFSSYPFSYDGVTMLGKLSQALKAAGFAAVSHAPQAPYLGCGVTCTTGMCTPPVVPGYLLLMEDYGDSIDFLNIQFYNNPPFNPVSAVAPLVEDLATGGTVSFGSGKTVNYQIPASKLVLGKPATPSDAGSGYSSPTDVEDTLQTLGTSKIAGFMTWQIDSDASNSFAMGKAAATGLGITSPPAVRTR